MPEAIIFTPEQINSIVEDYCAGLGFRTIARKFGCVAQVVKNCIIKNGLTVRPMNPTVGNEAEIARLYENGETFLSLAKRYQTDRRKIKSVILSMGISKRTHAEQQRKYNLKEDFFDSIDTEEKAYFLGFMYADGHNDKSGRTFSLALQLRDKPILDTFKHCLGYSGPLRSDSSNPNVSILTVSSVRMCARLTELDCPPKKSLILTFPEWMPNDLLHHFIRGYVDGDGWITGVAGKRISPKIGALGTDSFINSLVRLIAERVGVRAVVRGHAVSKGISRVIVSGTINCRKLADYLYKDATVFLERKKQRADLIKPVGRLLGEKNSQSILTTQQAQAIREDRAQGLKRTQLVEKYSVSFSTIDRVIYNSRYFAG